jgi:hypothetical protein
MVNYESTFGSYPPAVPACNREAWVSTGTQTGLTCAGPNWACQILGQVEEVDLDRMIVQCMERQWNACDDCEHDPWNVGRWTPEFMVCPSAPAPTKWLSTGDVSHERNSKGNYAACLGASTYRDSIDGSPEIDDEQLASPRENPAVPDTVENDDRYPARKLRKGIITVQLIPGWQNITRQDDPVARGAWKFGRGKGVKTRRIKDGVSKTIVCSEVLTWDGNAGSAADSEDIRGVWTTPSMGEYLLSPVGPQRRGYGSREWRTQMGPYQRLRRRRSARGTWRERRHVLPTRPGEFQHEDGGYLGFCSQ